MVSCPCRFGCRTTLWPVVSPYEIPKMPRSMKQRARADLGVVYGPWEVRMKSPKCLGHMKLSSSSRAPYGSKLDNSTTCRASPQAFSKIVRPVWAP